MMSSGSASTLNDELEASLGTKTTLGAALTKNGEYDEAESILKEVLETYKKHAKGETSPRMLSVMNNLAAVYHHQNRLAEAEELHRKVLEAEEKTAGNDNDNIVTSMHNLAGVLCDQGTFDEAQKLQERAVEISQRSYDREDTRSTVTLANNLESLGNTLIRQGKYEEAESAIRRALELHRKVLREGHPDTLSDMHNLSVALRKQGKAQEADELQLQEAALSQKYAEKPSSPSDSDSVLADQCHFDELEHSLQQKIKLSTNMTNTETRQNMSRLGDVLVENGKYVEAITVLRSAIV